jgi:cysteine synthase B
MAESWWVGEGSGGRPHDPGRREVGGADRDRIILDATSGNTGIAYAMIGAARGYRVRLCVPENVTPERKRILKAFGADVVYTDPMQGSDGRSSASKQMYAESPDLYFYPDQYNNPGNWRRTTTRRAGDPRTDRWPSHAFRGRARHERHVCRRGSPPSRVNPAIRLISVQPDSPLHGLEGLKHMETAIVPGIYDPTLADQDLGVSTEEAFELTRRLARKASSSASRAAPISRGTAVARSTSDAVVVVVFCDGGEKYCPSGCGTKPGSRLMALTLQSGIAMRSPRTARGLSERVLRRAHWARWRR